MGPTISGSPGERAQQEDARRRAREEHARRQRLDRVPRGADACRAKAEQLRAKYGL
jgi:hypothetical protein